MTTFYLDYEGGNDANDGLSFANRWKTFTSGATAARIAPGDTIRVMASPNPTSIGSATWTGGGRPTAKNIVSSTNATPIVVTVTAHDLVTGDYVSIASHLTNTNANGVWKVGTTTTDTFQILQMDGTNTTGNGAGGATGTVTKASNCIVKLASPLTQNIALCGGLGQKPAWTASTNVTAPQSTGNFKEGYSCASIAIGTAFTTGKAAYYTLPAALNLSGYQQVCFWFRTISVGAAGQMYLALCTDTVGNTVAHQCNIPNVGLANLWFPVVVDFGTNLNSAIQSVALYVTSDIGPQTVLIDNIFAAKAASAADSLILTSLVSKSNGSGDEAWYAIQSINYDAVMLANGNSLTSITTNLRGYSGTSETVTTYKRETVKTVPTTSFTTAANEVQDSGTVGNLITFSGGWNRTDMSTQTGETWFDGQSCGGYGILASAKSYVSIDKINLCRYTNGLVLATASSFSIGSMRATGCTSGINIGATSYNDSFTDVWVNNNGEGASTAGISIAGAGHTITNLKTAENSTARGVSLIGSDIKIGSVKAGNTSFNTSFTPIYYNLAQNVVIDSLTVANNADGYAIQVSSSTNCYINGGSTTSCVAGVFMGAGSNLFLNNFTINEATEVWAISPGTAYVYSNRHDNTDGNSWQWQGAGTINQQTSVVDSPATSSWKMSVTDSNASGTTPLRLKLGTVVCSAGSLVTVTARMRRDDTGLTMRLVCPGGQIVGVTNDVYSDMTSAANTWETVTITFTPTKSGGVDIYAYAFGGTTYNGYVCNLTASQA